MLTATSASAPFCRRRSPRPANGFSFSLLFCGAFSEVDFTTEAAQHDCRGDGRASHGTHEGTAFLDQKRSVGLGLQRNVIVDLALHGAGADVGGGVFGYRGIDIATMAGQAILAAVAEIAGVVDFAARGNNLH